MTGLALLGAGRIGKVHAKAIDALGARLVCVHDAVPAAAQALANEYGATTVDSAEAAANTPGVDGVVIGTPTPFHVEHILTSARAGKPVMCEKPIDLSTQRTAECAQALAETPVPVQIGFQRRFDPTHRAVGDAIASGAIGKLENLLLISRDPGMAHMEYVRSSGGIFKDMTIHDFDLARFLLPEEPVTVSATGSILVEPDLAELGDVDSVTVVMTTASGIQCQILNSRRCVLGYDQRIEAFGDGGTAVSENQRDHSMQLSRPGATTGQASYQEFFLERYFEAYRLEIEAFLDVVANGAAPQVTFDDGVKALTIAEAAGEALTSGRRVDLDL